MHLISNFITSDKKSARLSSKFPMLSIRSEIDFFLECDAYDIIIPLRKQETKSNSFSILERCILRLLSIDSELSNEEISEKLCLGTCYGSSKNNIDTSFVKIIRARLKDNGLLDTSGAVTPKGENVIRLVAEAENEETDETPVQVFCIRQLNNKLLSYIHVGEIESESYDLDNRMITLKYGSAGKEKEVRGKLISYQHNRNKPDYIGSKPPTRDEIIRLISRYNKMCRSGEKRIQYDSRYGFNVSPTPSTVIIHMKALLQNGNVLEPIISDGFSCNIEGLVQYMNADSEKESNKYKADIIRSLFEHELVIKDSNVNNEVTNKRDYNEIYRELEKLTVQTGDSLDGNMIADRTNARIIKGCYGALEWTLHYYLIKKQDLGKTIKLLIGNSSYANKVTSSEYILKHGMELAETDVTISSADKNTIEKWINESENGNVIPSLKVLLPVVLCYAHVADEPNFKAMALQYPDFMSRIEKLHKYANSARHNGSVDISANEILENVSFSKCVISKLIPEITIGDAEINQKDSISSSSYIVNNMINLTTSEIGWDLWNSLSDSVKNLLIDLAPDNDKDITTKLSSLDFITSISQVLEELIYEEIRKLDISDKPDKPQIIEIIENKLESKIPEGYYFASDVYFSAALDRKKSTLNAMTLVYLGFANNYYFDKLKNAGFLEYVMTISDLRGHGNTVNLVVNDEDRIKLRKKLFDILKIIGG